MPELLLEEWKELIHKGMEKGIPGQGLARAKAEVL